VTRALAGVDRAPRATCSGGSVSLIMVSPDLLLCGADAEMPFGHYAERADTDHGLEQDFNSARRDEQEADCNHSAIMF
jgi:hypothetical protein